MYRCDAPFFARPNGQGAADGIMGGLGEGRTRRRGWATPADHNSK
jgi:hypothetical protein